MDEKNNNADTLSSAPAGKKQNKTVMYIVIAVIVLIVVGYVAKYAMGMLGMAALNAKLSSEGVKISGNPLSGGSYTITGKDGQMVTVNADDQGTYNMTDEEGNQFTAGAGAKIPDDFPPTVPIYRGSTVQSNVTTNQNGKAAHMVTLITKDSYGEVATYYKKSLSENGWKTLQDMNMSSSYSMFVAENGSLQLTAMVQGESGSEGTTIVLSAAEKQ